MNTNEIPPADAQETKYVQALSRESTVRAYAEWNVLSDTEKQYIDQYLKRGDRVLDLGCGTGRIVKILGTRLGEYVGVDCSEKMIRTASENNPGFCFLCEDILYPSYEEHGFDVVLLMNNVLDMLHPIERRHAVFDLVRNLLAPSGRMICSSHLAHRGCPAGYYQEEYHGTMVSTYRSSLSQLCEEIERHGFEIISAARDYRAEVADWVYFAASGKAK